MVNSTKLRATVLGLVASLFVAANANATLVYTSDKSASGFDATTVGSLPSGWTAVSGTWSAQATSSNLMPGHTHDFENTSQGAGSIDDTALYTGNGTAADMEITYAQIVPTGGYNSGTGLISSLGAYVRSDSGNNNGYLFIFGEVSSSEQILIFKKVSGTLTQIASGSLGFTPAVGQKILSRFNCVGTSINVKVWPSTSAEPTSWSVSVTDSSVTAAGYAGLRATMQIASVATNASDVSIDTQFSSDVETLAPVNPVTPSGGNITVSGLYSGTAPSALNYAIDGGSYSAASSPTISGGTFSFAITAPAAGTHSINVQDNGTATHTDSGVYIVNATSTTTFNMNNANIYLSPYAWLLNGSTYAETTAPGNYIKIAFSGSTTLSLNVDVSPLSGQAAANYPIIRWTVDNNPYQTYQLQSTDSQVSLNTGLSTGAHTAQIYLGSDKDTLDRWNTPVSVLRATGITLDSGSTLSAPTTLPKKMLLYGDSITEGVMATANYTATSSGIGGDTPANNDAMLAWPRFAALAMNAETGTLGYGGTGWSVTFANIPPLYTPGNDTSSSWNKYFSGQSRLVSSLLSPAPDYIVINDGENDGTTNIQSNVSGLLTALRAAAPNAWIFLTIPWGGNQSTNITAAFNSYQSSTPDAKCKLIDLGIESFFNLAVSPTNYGIDGVHPRQQTGGIIAAMLTQKMQSAMGGGGGGGIIIGDIDPIHRFLRVAANNNARSRPIQAIAR